jgi:uncharacterized protein (UPF0332 family)
LKISNSKSKRQSKIDKEFKEKCLSKRTIVQEPNVKEILRKEARISSAEQHKNNADYFLNGAKSLLNSETPLIAVLIGHFAMEHKGNQLLALHGYDVESHICTQIGLSRIVGRKDLAKKLSEIFGLRQNVGYRMYLKPQSEEDKNTAEKTINETVIPFFEEIDKLVNEVK